MPEPVMCRICEKRPGVDEHVCPYQLDVEDDTGTNCNCCEQCAKECSDNNSVVVKS